MTITRKDFINFDINELYSFLLNQEKPLMEVSIIKQLSGLDSISQTKDSLYIYHFSMVHALYHLKMKAGNENYYVHLHPSRIRMIKLPESGCLCYDEHSGQFCGKQIVYYNYCENHKCNQETQAFYFDPMRDFYLNKENIVFGNSNLLEKIMNGIIVYAFRPEEINKALHFFQLKNPTKDKIKKRYFFLAQQYHPDKQKGDNKKMKMLNASYQVLKEVYAL